MQGLQKPILYLENPKKKDILGGKLPFDIDDQIYIEHTDAKSLEMGLDNKIGLLLEKVRLSSGFDSAQKELVKSKLDSLSNEAKELLKRMVLEGSFFQLTSHD